MTLIIVAAAIGALVLLIAILALGRSRFADESERFRYVSDLTSQWSRQKETSSAMQEQPADRNEPAKTEPIDLRDGEHQSSGGR